MIQANELRIGNIVKIHVGEGHWSKVSLISPTMVDVEILGDGEEYVSFYQSDCLRSLEPIPLTPEILEMCGFEVVVTSMQKRAELKFQEDCSLWFYQNIRTSEINWTLEDLFDGVIEVKCTPKYLHQLQNLYFALTGKELELQVSDATT